MTRILTMSELLKMNEQDLLREVHDQRRLIAKLQHAVQGGSEKGHHLLRQAKQQLARMLTAFYELRRGPVSANAPV